MRHSLFRQRIANMRESRVASPKNRSFRMPSGLVRNRRTPPGSFTFCKTHCCVRMMKNQPVERDTPTRVTTNSRRLTTSCSRITSFPRRFFSMLDIATG